MRDRCCVCGKKLILFFRCNSCGKSMCLYSDVCRERHECQKPKAYEKKTIVQFYENGNEPMLQTSKLLVESVYPLYQELKRCEVEDTYFAMGGYWWHVYDGAKIGRDYSHTFRLETDFSRDPNLLDE